MLDLSKPVETRSGRKVRILCTDAKDDYPVVGLVQNTAHDGEYVERWSLTGQYHLSKGNPLDLVNVAVEHTVWINIYSDDNELHKHTSAAKARHWGTNNLGEELRIACKKITYKEGEFDE